MLKKEEIFVSVITEKQKNKVKNVLEMFGETYYVKRNESGLGIYFNMAFECWMHGNPGGREQVSIRELKNILAVKHFKPSQFIVVKGSITSELYVCEVTGMDLQLNEILFTVSGRIMISSGYKEGPCYMRGHFKRFATSKEILSLPKLIVPYKLATENDKDIATIEALHDTLIDNHGYDKDCRMLKNARELISKMYNNEKH